MYLFYRLANEKALSSLRRYHYYGLCVKDASPYRDTLLSNQRVSADELQGQRTETLAARAQQLCALPVNPQGLIADFPTVNCLPAPIRLQVSFLIPPKRFMSTCKVYRYANAAKISGLYMTSLCIV